jgi:Fur family transcriptional regulator, ferric uptake regulator
MTTTAPHEQVKDRLEQAGQRYTAGRQALVVFLHTAGHPVDMNEITAASPGLPMSSVYRNLVVLEQAGAVTRLQGPGALARYELSEELLGHHHHLVCSSCGRMEDYQVPPEVEGALLAATRSAASSNGFKATGHRLELRGLCARCRQATPGTPAGTAEQRPLT